LPRRREDLGYRHTDVPVALRWHLEDAGIAPTVFPPNGCTQTNCGVFVTTGRFTRGARQFAESVAANHDPCQVDSNSCWDRAVAIQARSTAPAQTQTSSSWGGAPNLT